MKNLIISQLIPAGISVFLIAPLVLFVHIMLNAPPPTYDLEREILTPIVAPGQNIEVKFTATHRKGAACVTTVEPYLWDSIGLRHEFRHIHRVIKGDGKRKSGIAKIKVPPQTPSGKLVYEPVISYYCNPLQRWWPAVRDDVEPFEVEVKDLGVTGGGTTLPSNAGE